MNLRLVREPSLVHATLGVLFVNGRFECFMLEDEIREPYDRPIVSSAWVQSWKVPGQTAIPAGRYRILITRSARFQRDTPELVNVPGFSGIRIHPGNTIENTEGCLLPGRLRAAQRVGDSKLAYDAIIAKMMAASARREAIWIDVENPRERDVVAA